MEQDKGLTAIINSITENLTTLVRGHIELAKAELIEALKNIAKSSVLFILALAMVNLGIIFLFIAIGFWISETFEMASSTGFFISGGLLFVTALIFVGIAVAKLKSVKNSRKTIDSLNATTASILSFRPGKNN